ncbi:GAF and ANTAR domain-containing protein [Streptomyces sp. A7024]|uniref:GAF and ANTAR domain-containing protein n=1 Tax=Streptomyces coryli TaxID=1128680 RepID=A0A6G4U332_9ACTN|nr:GAF and ANTAR domain-containing protein [Streptomyces coryli]NGN66669.1 GAF and ANTAR domain-containing protein [Streptomyces coryli]
MTTPGHHRLAAAFVDLTGGSNAPAGGSPFDVTALLRKLANHSAGLLGASAAYVLLAEAHGGSAVVPADPGTRLDGLAYELAGPARTCCDTGIPVPALALSSSAVQSRWPRFAAWAQGRGYAQVAVVPLRAHTETVGALALLAAPHRPLPDAELPVGQSLADVTALMIVRERERAESRALTDQLQHALTSRVAIEQAKGMLAVQHTLTPDEAFALLRGHARSRGRLLADVAHEVIDGNADLA